MEAWIPLGYLLSAALFIFGLKKLGHPRTAPRGNQYGAMGMLVAVLTTIVDMQLASGGMNWELIIAGLVVGSVIGIIMAIKVEMTGMPELVALFNGFGGAASALVALSETWKYIENPDLPLPTGLELEVVVIAAGLSALVGWMTLTGSILAMFKLKGGIEVFGKWFSTPTWGSVLAEPCEGRSHRERPRVDCLVHQRPEKHRLPLGHRRYFLPAWYRSGSPHRWSRHAGGCFVAQLPFWNRCSLHGLHHQQPRPDRRRFTRRCIRIDLDLHHVQGHEPNTA